ncbi:MAG TPA: ADOP family duplicated permease [Longimicrobiaceae bacterium]|nr:ADOP family duplicated permease [Longimicrobiaceae bacterium]
MPTPPHDGDDRRLPAVPAALLRHSLPHAERAEVLADLADEYRERSARRGRPGARLWLWGQALASLPALLRRSWWRGWTGFEPRANRMQPGGPLMESWIMDARFVARRLRSRPGYAVLAVLTLALGVGGTAAVYGVARTLLLDPLPYRAEQQLAVFWNPFDWRESEFLYLGPDFPGFQGVAAYRTESVTMEGSDGPPRLLPGLSSSAGLFDVLGTRPLVGPGFRPGDDALAAEPTAVLSYGLWRELGGDPGIVGSRVRLDGVERTVRGVMPEGFWFPDPTVRVWLAEPLDPENNVGNYALVGRMEPGRTPETMGPALKRITDRLSERFTYSEQWDKTRDPVLTPVRETLVGHVRPALLATLAAMGLILLIACANVAALMLGQVDRQSTELALRSALGAGRWRLVQQVVIEAVAVGLLAGVAGALLAAAGFRLLVGALPLGPLAEGASLDWRVFVAAIAIATLASLLVALVPGFSLWRGDLQRVLSRTRTGGIGGRGGRIERGLVMAEVALAVLMVSGAALLIRSVANLRAIDPGVDVERVAVLDLVSPAATDAAGRRQMLRELTRELADLPGLESAAAVQKLPLRGSGDSWGIQVEGRTEENPGTTYFRMVSPDYFRTMGIAVRRGRGFEPSDRAEGEPVVVVNEALAQKHFPGEDPVGRRIAHGDGWARIVGVVENVAEAGLTDGPEPARYMLYEQVPFYTPEANTLVLRAGRGGAAGATLEAARGVVRRVAPGAALQTTMTLEQVFSEAVGPARQVMSLLALLGGLAMVLGAIGVYGIVSHLVNRQKRDWGIRIALGLQPRRVVAQVVRGGGALVASGIVLGAAAFLATARWLASFLYGVGAADPLAMAAAAGVLLLAGLVAAFVPAWRASRTDPAKVLREA